MWVRGGDIVEAEKTSVKTDLEHEIHHGEEILIEDRLLLGETKLTQHANIETRLRRLGRIENPVAQSHCQVIVAGVGLEMVEERKMSHLLLNS